MGKETRRWLYTMVPLLVIVSIILLQSNMHQSKYLVSAQDKRTALRLADINKVDQEQLLRERAAGVEWDEITSRYAVSKSIKNRSLSVETEQSLLEKGYSKETIQEAVWRLDEIQSALSELLMTPMGIRTENSENELEIYRKLYESVDYDKGIPLVLEVAKALGGLEQALDEYLCSVQLDMDLTLYLEDRERYEQKRTEKKILYQKELLTASAILSKRMERLQKKQTEKGENDQVPFQTPPAEELTPKGPEVDRIKPPDPLGELQKEIDDIRKQSFGMEIR